MRASGVNAAVIRVIGKLEHKKNARNRNCAHWGSAHDGVLPYSINLFKEYNIDET